MPRKTLRRGIGAKCTIPKRFLHSKRTIDTNTYYQNKQDVDGLLIIGRGERKINNKQVMCCLFRNDRFDNNTILYCVEKFAKVVEEGPAEHFFSAPVATVGVGENKRRSSTVNVPAARNNDGVMAGGDSGRASAGASAGASAATNMNVNVNLSTENLAREEQEGAITFRITTARVDDQEDIARIRDMGFDVDDNNEPAPENVPDTQQQQPDRQNNHGLLLDHKQEWKDDAFVDKAAPQRGKKPRIRTDNDIRRMSIL